MNRVGLKDYLLNHADDNDLLDCAKAWDAANEYGQFDTYSSVEEAAQANGWDAAQALSEARRVDQDADHDGRACVEMRQLTDKGEELYSEFETDGGFYLPETGFEAMGFVYRKGDENAFIHDLWGNPEMCSKPRWAEKVGGSPAEEYIMEHDGVKTEFQITEVKRGSFAYDQGARFDVKVLTDGYDCGNGHFCADAIAGHGESIDDMCEDRSEVASAVQDAHTGERYHEDEQRDNSEIGD